MMAEEYDYDQILATLDDAENKVAKLKALLLDRHEGQSDSDSRFGSGSSGGNPADCIFSKDNIHYTRFMTMSTVKLFENRGVEVFRVPGSVGLYFICPNNPVRTAARSAVLRIVRIAEEYQDEFHPPAFVQVGNWVYPLMPGSMLYRTVDKYYLFPDLTATIPGSSVGVVLPHSCTAQERETFESLLLEFSGIDAFPESPPFEFGKSTHLMLAARTSVSLIKTKSGVYSERTSNPSSSRGYGKRIGAGIKAGGELVSRGLELGAVGASSALSWGAQNLKRALPKEEPGRQIPCVIVDGVACARNTTEKVVELSASLLTTLGEVTSNFAALTACYIKAASAPLVNKLVEASGISQETIDAVATEVKDVGEGIVGGTADAYRGLENAAKIMADSISSNTAEVVEHCYGPAAASVLVNATHVIGNAAISGMNAGQMVDPEKIIKKTVRKTGLAMATTTCK